ncbi:Uma2 family endonuclease [Streptacidiphilus neutrinimicus]|uniref:Uma2 family endonuclease n=1 Tax=Streptacidiphilus neutrinimicus TaxID=105420 RepID=UPI0005A6DB48|nr:Uma2 family endonuclease [Streptacidiphilus neutrinimicus]
MTDIARIWESFEPPSGLVAQYYGGQIVMQANPLLLHDLVIRSIVRQDFDPYEAWGERGIDLGTDGEPCPDVVVMHRDDIDLTVRNTPAQVVRVVGEVVSPSSAKADWRDKRELYAAHGIPLYLVIDPRHGTWHVLTLDNLGYVQTQEGIFGQSIPLPLPDGPTLTVTTTGWHPYPTSDG